MRGRAAHHAEGDFDEILGTDNLDKVINIDQKPIGRTPRSNPATYTKVFDHIRDFFAKLPESRMRGYQKGRYSFNVKGGRCEKCDGDGHLKVEMHFLADVYVPCESCRGKRFNQATLAVKYKGHSIADVLDLSVAQARALFSHHPKITAILDTLMDVGLSYIKLGQSATTLSGGEAQRIKLARELAKRATGQTLYILDEPTTGLDPNARREIWAILMKLKAEAQTSLILTTHYMEEADRLSHRVAFLDRGKIVALDTPENLKTTYGNTNNVTLEDIFIEVTGRSLK